MRVYIVGTKYKTDRHYGWGEYMSKYFGCIVNGGINVNYVNVEKQLPCTRNFTFHIDDVVILDTEEKYNEYKTICKCDLTKGK